MNSHQTLQPGVGVQATAHTAEAEIEVATYGEVDAEIAAEAVVYERMYTSEVHLHSPKTCQPFKASMSVVEALCACIPRQDLKAIPVNTRR